MDWVAEYKKRGALWMHDGNPQRPHAQLTSGLCSNGFINSEKILQDPLFVDVVCAALVDRLVRAGLSLEDVDWVVGPAMGAITLAHDVARHIGVLRGRPCLFAYAEKDITAVTGVVFRRAHLGVGERVLIIEDVLSTGKSVARVMHAVQESGAKTVPFIGVLVNRSGHTQCDDVSTVVSGITTDTISTWQPVECPLCRAGSVALRPKVAENWSLLAPANP